DAATITEESLGIATETFSLIETGNFITDTMRKNIDSEIALFLDGGKDGAYNNKGVTAKLYAGEITKSDIQRIMPDFKYGEKGEIWKVTMTGENLLNTLEYAIPVDNNQTGWFYYFSGLKMNYDPTNEPGSRIKTISLDDGTKIDPTKIYSLAVTENSVPEEYIITSYKTGVILGDLLAEEIQKLETISPANDNRFTFK
ncbi:5'-nucleotidase, partial [Anaerorhabdus sp.]